MSDYLGITTPAAKDAGLAASVYGLEHHGLTRLQRIYWNLTAGPLYEEAIFRREGRVAADGAFVVGTGAHTARAAADKFIVSEATSHDKVWWGEYNRPFLPETFTTLMMRLQGYLQGRDVFVQDAFAGAGNQPIACREGFAGICCKQRCHNG